VAQADRVRLVDQRKATLAERGQDLLIGQQPIAVADQRKRVRVR
jgi:hypothetical protein